MKQNITKIEVEFLKKEYDFSKAVKNPYVKKMKRQITINIDSDTVDYFKGLSGKSGIPYQTLINLYLTDCAISQKTIDISWKQQ